MKNKLRIIFLLFFFVARASITPPGIKINEREYSVLGIDISEHTGKIDFKKINTIYLYKSDRRRRLCR